MQAWFLDNEHGTKMHARTRSRAGGFGWRFTSARDRVRNGARTCTFTSFEQCMMTATPGTGGMCVQNPWYMQYGERGQGQGGGDRPRPKRQ